MDRLQNFVVRYRHAARLIWVGAALGALALSGIAPDPWP